ncbi:MAG: hypothetical protein ACLFVN_02935 [Phycisphaeraceae bacterium]
MTIRRTLLLLTLAALTGCAAKPMTPQARLDSLLGDHGAALENDRVRLSVAPDVGRIVEFAPASGDNLLWLDPQGRHAEPFTAGGRSVANFGGDKLWPTTQALWERAFGGGGWPPDGVLDGQPWQLSQSPQRITLESRLQPALGIRASRTIELIDGQPAARITNRFHQLQPTVFPVNIWSITQVQRPPHVLMDVAPDAPTPPGNWMPLADPENVAAHPPRLLQGSDVLAWQLPTDVPAKIGTLGRWVAAVYDDLIFLQVTSRDPDAMYPDASSAQIFTCPAYTELELLTEARHLEPGQTMQNVVTWHLLPREGDSLEAAATQIEQFLAK